MSLLSRLLAGWYIQIFHQTLIDRNRDRRHPESGRITKEDIKTMTRDTFDNYQRLIVNVDLGPTYGSSVMVRNGVLSLSLYRAIRKLGADRDYATELCTDVLWKIYKKQVWIQRLLARLMSRNPQKQMNRIQKFFLSFPLARPGYEWEINEIESITSYDIFRCPVCDYFKTLEQEDLEFFRNSWCTLDYPLAEYLVKGGKYERQHTLSAGDTRCDMRWMAVASGDLGN